MAIVNFNFSDSTGQAYNGNLTVTPISITSGNNVIYVGDSVTNPITNGGNISLSLTANTYLVGILANLSKTEFFIAVPTGSAAYSASALVIPTTGSIY